MLSASHTISPQELWNAIATPRAPLVVDTRRAETRSLLERGLLVYDALFAWLRFAAEERHNWPAKAA